MYQSGPSGETLYKTVQTASSTVGVDLLFTDAVDYTYRFEAYANMGELTEAPSEVSFEDESLDGFQMHGTLEGIDASSASSATVMLDRYVGRVIVGSVKLLWKDQANASQEFTLKRMWLANAAAVSGGEAAYNVGGAYSASVMDALLVSEVNQVIADGGTYDVPHYLYAYASGSTALVLECEWAGQTMYYHVDYEPVANSSMTYTLSIHQTGSSEPLGDVTDDALVAAGALQANDWNATDSKNAFGEAPPEATYFYIEALEDNTEVKFSTNPIQYSLDGKVWTELPAGTKTPSIENGKRIYFKGEGLTPNSSNGIGIFTVLLSNGSRPNINVGGNIMSLLFGDEFYGKRDLTGYDYAFYTLFKGNRIISASELVLPATVLSGSCYSAMFSGITQLKSVPSLPATVLAKNCYASMFSGCNSLTEAPELPATELAEGCYILMFSSCSSLVSAPELPATELAKGCYASMFSSCSSLVSAPELPAINLKSECYKSMFGGCSSLTETPCLPAVYLAYGCYKGMFSYCTSLSEISELPATTLADNCYNEMFKSCRSLDKAPELPATTLAEYCYASMFEGCTSLTEAPELPVTTLAKYCYNSMFRGCTSLVTAPDLPARVMSRGCYASMFYGCSSLVNVPDLTSTSLDVACYSSMFANCTSLINAPVLSAATNVQSHSGMFSGCTSLVNAPDLPATYVSRLCYALMFKGCTSLVSAPDLPAIKLESECYKSMFSGCTSLASAPDLPATTLYIDCYKEMFSGCTSLTKAPDLLALDLVSGCYANMFKDCSNLNYVKALFTTKPSDTYMKDWLSGVSASGTFIENEGTMWAAAGLNAIPDGWTKEQVLYGASVYHVNGSFYSPSEWTEAKDAGTVTDSDAVGVSVSDGEHSLVFHPTECRDGLAWSSTTSVSIEGVYTTVDEETANCDYSGEANTAAILAAVSSGVIADAPAAAYCDGITFAHGKKGHLPSMGEMRLCLRFKKWANEGITAIGGMSIGDGNKSYHTSTQYSDRNSWYILTNSNTSANVVKTYSNPYVRAVSAL